MRHRLRQALLGWTTIVCGGFMIPLNSPSRWEVLSFSRIPPNRVAFERQGLRIDIDRSAGPLVYRLPEPMTVGRVVASGRVSGRLSLDGTRAQGTPGADDYVLRIGLVEAGTRRIGLFQRLVAPTWVKRLFALAPADTGISRVLFLNVAETSNDVGTTRQHPLSDLLHERVVTAIEPAGGFTIDHTLDRATRVLAVWLSSDGDDTSSRFSVKLERLDLE